MKRFSEQLHKQATTVKLRAAEKRELKERLVSYMEYHPLPAEMKATKSLKKQKKAPVMTDAFSTISIPFATIFKSSAVMAVLILVVLPFVAERAVPGDTLYAVKVQFNEEIRSTLTFDSYQKVEWETERLNRRIAEARLLASEGRLTEEVEAEVAEAVRTHTENAKREIEVLRTEDADDAIIASIALDTTLEVQSTAFKGEETTEEEGVEEGSAPSSLIADAINESREPTEEFSDATPPAYNKLMARVEQNTTRVYELLSTINGAISDEEQVEVTRRIEDIERTITEAIGLSEVGDNQAQIKLINALQRSQKLIVFMTELEVKETVDIETLVPVELTAAEKVVAIAKTKKEIEEKIEQIARMRAGVDDPDVIEKVNYALALIEEKSAGLESLEEDYSSFKTLSEEIIVTADDTIAFLEQYYTPVDVPEIEEETATSSDEEVDEEETATSSDEIVEEVTEEAIEGELAAETIEETVEEPTEETAEVVEEEPVDTENVDSE